jgi:prepilin-type N-terminal cleavage/methylation domain-containing protein
MTKKFKFISLAGFLKEQGFTLIEAVVALVILSVVSVASIAYFTFGTEKKMDMKTVNYGYRIAEDLIEELRAQSYVAASSGVGPQTFTKYGTIFTREYAVSEPALSTGKFKVITVTVTWTSDGVSKAVNIYTRISPHE